jgi:undecaprenyl pyrophosphate phosphatase UppP
LKELLNFASFFYWTYDYRFFLFGIASDDFTKLFTIVIQLGAILCSFIFQTFLSDLGLLKIICFIPAVVLGLLFSDLIDELLRAQSQLLFSFTWWYCFIKS